MPALLFDIDDTLYNLLIPFQNACRALWGNQFDSDMEALFIAYRRHSDDLFEDSQNGTLPKEAMYRIRIQRTMQDVGIVLSDETASKFQRIYLENQQKISLSDTVRQLLNFCLRHHAAAGIITNGYTNHQWNKTTALGLERWFTREQTIISGDIGIGKPYPDIFRYAEKKLNLCRQECWYIGDSFVNDIEGALKAGWHAIWFNRRKHPIPKTPFSPDFTVYTEEELFETVKNLL